MPSKLGLRMTVRCNLEPLRGKMTGQPTAAGCTSDPTGGSPRARSGAGDGHRNRDPSLRPESGSPTATVPVPPVGAAQFLAVLPQEALRGPAEMLLAPLLDADRDRPLLRTPATLRDVGTTPSAAAARLGVHRNSSQPASTVSTSLAATRTPQADGSHCASRAVASCSTSTSPGLPVSPPSRQPADHCAHCDGAAAERSGPSRPLKRPNVRRCARPLAAHSCRRPRCPAVCFIESSVRRRDPARQRPAVS